MKEAAVLASAVLEVFKRLAAKSAVDPAELSLEPLIDELAKRDVVTPVKAKRLRSYAAIRNHALHAEWDKLDLKDVGAQISGLRELLDEHL